MSRPTSLIGPPGPTLASVAAVGLTALALSPTVEGGPWYGVTLGLILVLAATGTALRAMSWPAWSVVSLQAAVAVVALTVVFAGDVAGWGFVPGVEVWRTFGDLAEQGLAVVEQEAAPVTLTEGVRFLLVGGVTLIAWAVDSLAVTLRRATLAGIPLLALYLVPATVLPEGVPWPLFLTAGIGWLVLLLADGRQQLTRWGRPVRGSTSRLQSVGGTGRRLGAAALGIALVVPVVLPSLDDGRFGGNPTGEGDGEGGGVAAGTQRVITVNPIVDLKRNLTRGRDVEVLRYTTGSTTPTYLRIATLDQFDGTSWTLEEMQAPPEQQASRGLPVPPGLDTETVPSTPVGYTIEVGDLDTPRLPLPYPVSSVEIDGDWRWDADTFDVFSAAEGGTALGLSYGATALVVSPSADQLRAAGPADPSMDTWLQLPGPVDEQLSPLALEVTADAVSDYDRALALQNWFRSEFTYSLETAAGNDTEALTTFLQDRSGYCEQFAATMALMARTLGIPSRVQVGFTPGTATEGDTWVVTLHDAHAWPELWFEGVGWVRFEPTPGGGDGGAAPAYAPPPTDSGTTAGPRTDNGDRGVVLRRGGQEIGGRPDDRRLPGAAEPDRSVGRTGITDPAATDEGSSTGWWFVGALLLSAAALAAPYTARRVRRARRARTVVDAPTAVAVAWADVLDTATDVDLEPTATETPRDLAHRIPRRGGLMRGPAAQMEQLAGWVERTRYGTPGAVDLPPVEQISSMARDIEQGLMAALSPRDRRRAVTWPRSGRQALAVAWAATGEWVARTTARAKDAVRGTVSGRRRAGAPSALRSGS